MSSIWKKTAILLGIMVTALVSCKSSYIRIGDENANYIPYYLKVYEADSLFIVGDYERSYEILDSLFKKYEPINIDGYEEYLIYIASSIELNNIKKNRLRKRLKYLYANHGNHDVFIEYFTTDKVKGFIETTDTLGINIGKQLMKYNKSVDSELRHLVENMVKEDLEAREGEIKVENLERVNLRNTQLLDSLIQIDKFPNYKLIGNMKYSGNDANIKALMTHTDQKYKEDVLLEKLFDYMLKGEVDSSTYARVYDRYYFINNGEVYFGDQGKVTDTAMTNIRRQEIGLHSLSYNRWCVMKKYNMEY